MKNLLTALFLIGILTISVFPCGAPKSISGKVLWDYKGLPMAAFRAELVLRNSEGEPIGFTYSNPFGGYYFGGLGGCPENYSIHTTHKEHKFPVLLIDHTEFEETDDLWRNIWAYSLE